MHLVHGLGAPRVAVKTPALRALDLIFDQVRALRPGTQEKRFARHAFPETEAPTSRSGPRLSGTFPAQAQSGYQLNGSEH